MSTPTETDSLLSHRQNGDRGQSEGSLPKLAISICIALGMLIVVGFAGYSLGRSSAPSTLSFERTQTSLRFDVKSPRNYEGTQFISFTINTLGGKAEFGECPDLLVDPESNTCYLGNAQNLTEDVFHRLEIVQGVLSKLEEAMLEENSEIDRSPNVLKIFSMPEFFLRGPHGAYSTLELIDREGTENDGLLVKVGDRIRQLIERDTFEDFLFVFGTVLVAESLENPGTPFYEIHHGAEKLLYSNFAPVYKGGRGHTHHYLLQKHYISGADFLSRTGTLPNPVKADLRK